MTGDTAITRGDARKAAEGLAHLSGFGNEHASEAVPGALPEGRNAPQRAPSACTRSSSAVRRSPSPAPTTAAPGCTGSAPPPRTRRSPTPTTAGSARPPSPSRSRTPTGCAGTPAGAGRGHRLPRRPVDPRRQRRRHPAHRYGRAPLPRHRFHGPRLQRRRRRAADRPGARRAVAAHGVRTPACGAGPCGADPSRGPLPCGAAGRVRARLCVRELRGALPTPRPGADRRQRPRQPP